MQLKGIKILKRLNINGIVLYPFILYAEKEPDDFVVNHEHIHWQQIQRDGFWRFYFNYLAEYLRGRIRGDTHDQAYRLISYEEEAYREQRNFAYRVGEKKKKRAG